MDDGAQGVSRDGAVPLNLYRVSAPATSRVVSNVRLTPEGYDDVRHIVLDMGGLDYRFIEGQSMGVLTPGVDPKGRANKLRLYSIASSRMGDDGRGRTAALCVKRVVVPDPVTGQVFRGVASNFLCDLRVGDPVPITGPAGKTFVIPTGPTSNLILVATGTGIAPFRAFLQRMYGELPAWSGAVRLFFGVRTEAECLYRSEFERCRSRPGFDVCYAFSREQQTADGARMYVHHRMAERMDDLWPMLMERNTYLYVCGIKGMEVRIEQVLAARAAAEGLEWREVRRGLVREGRYLTETY